jgi:hypothetical protein
MSEREPAVSRHEPLDAVDCIAGQGEDLQPYADVDLPH